MEVVSLRALIGPLLIGLSLLPNVGHCDTPSPVTQESVQEHLESLNSQLLLEYMLNNNPQPMADNTTDNFFVVTPGGVESKEHVIATVGQLALSGAEITPSTFQLMGDSAFLVGTIKGDGNLGGRPMPTLTYLSVYVRTTDGWRLAARSLTPLLAAPGKRLQLPKN